MSIKIPKAKFYPPMPNTKPSKKAKQGYYIDNEGYERCNNCNEHETGLKYFKFCPNCGMKV